MPNILFKFSSFKFLRFGIAAGLLTALIGGASAQSGLATLRGPSASGSFLAGVEAIQDLSTQEAMRFFMDAAESEWDNALVVTRAFEAQVANGAITDAAAMAKHVLSVDPQNEMAPLVLGVVALKQRQYSSAVKVLGPVEASSFVGITANMLRAWALIGDDNYPAAQGLLNGIARGGLDEFLVFHRALMADVAGSHDDALNYAELAYENESFVERIVEAYARMLANGSEFEKAQRVLDNYSDQGLSTPLLDALAVKIAAKARPGKLASNAQSGAAEMFFSIGVALASDGTQDVAAMFLRLAGYLDPKSEVITIALGDLLASSAQYEASSELFGRIPASSPLRGQALVNIADNYNAVGDRDEAIRRLNNLSIVDPGNLDAVAALGDLLRYEKDYAGAVDAYTRVLEITGGNKPNDWRYYYVRGISYERQDNWESAEVDFLKALDLSPGQPQVLNYLGYSWVDQGLHLNRALAMIEDAVEWDPSDGYVVDSLGWAFYRLGRLDDAVDVLENAVLLRPADPEINDHLGDAYWRVGRKLEARFQWAIAVDLDEDGTVAERAAPKLISGLAPDTKS